MAATTPAASRTISELPTFSSQVTSWTSCGISEKLAVGSPTWIIRVSFSGMPISVAISAASSSPRSFSLAPTAASSSTRSSGVVLDQESKAARAARTARSASSGVPSGIRPMTSSVEGFTTSIVPSPAGSTHSPPM